MANGVSHKDCLNCREKLRQSFLTVLREEAMSQEPELIAPEVPGQIHPLGHTHGENCPHAPAHLNGGRHEFANGLISCATCGITLREIGDFRPLPDAPTGINEDNTTKAFATLEEFDGLNGDDRAVEIYRLLINLSDRVNNIGAMTDWLVQGTEGLFNLADTVKEQGLTPAALMKMMIGGKL